MLHLVNAFAARSLSLALRPGGRRYLRVGIGCAVATLVLLSVIRADDRTPEPATHALAPAISAKDLDLPNCVSLHDGVATPADPNAVLGALGLRDSTRAWAAGQPSGKAGAKEGFSYVIAFSREVPVGSVMADNRRDYEAQRDVYVLKPGAAYPPKPADKTQWERLTFPGSQSGMRLATLPAGFKTRAVLTEAVQGDQRGERSEFGALRLFTARLHNVMPTAFATAQAEYTITSPLAPPVPLKAENVITGNGVWQSNGKEDGIVRGAAVSEFDPCWFVVQWDQPRVINGLYLDDNFTKVKFYAWKGSDSINPVIGSDDEWLRIKYEERVTNIERHRDRWVDFQEPVKARAIKVQILSTASMEVQIARISGMHVLTDLGAAAVPDVKVTTQRPPYKIHYELPQDAMTTVAIDGPDGRRVRNLIAREERKKGKNEEDWDLKDELGHPVVPGKYTLQILQNPSLHLKYQMTPYPNIEENTKDNSPWLNGVTGGGGWLADHTSCSSVCAAGDHLFVGAGTAESGVALIECDLTGRKLWGHHNFLAWTGPTYLAGDDKYAYVGIQPNFPDHGDIVYRVGVDDKAEDKPIDLPGTGSRKRGMVGIAVRDGKVYLAVNSKEDVFANSAAAEDVDLDHSFPSYPKINRRAHDTQATWVADRRGEFAGLFRMSDAVPGHRGLITIDSMKVAASRQHVVLAFLQPVPIGSLVFPMTKDLPTRLSLLKPDVKGTPDGSDESQWQTVWQSPKGFPSQGGWTVVPAPKAAVSRALRITFSKQFDDIEDILSAGDKPKDKDGDLTEIAGRHSAAGDDKQAGWVGSIEGMKILRRRFASLLPEAKVAVNSGKINDAGEWDAQRTEPLSAKNPGIYALEFKEAKPVRGLAIKEIDGRFTDIDVWTGPETGAIDIASDKGWTKVATYEQKRRFYGAVEANLGPNNASAKYVDGYVDFGKDITTRAIRLRVVSQWFVTGVGTETTRGVRDDRGGMEIVLNRCRVYGVAPLQMIGDEVPVDPMIGQRIEVWDTASVVAPDPKHPDQTTDAQKAKLLKEIPFPRGGQIAFAPDGKLYGISNNQVIEVDIAGGGKGRTVVSDVSQPQSLAFDASGNLYVLDNAPDRKVFRVYDTAGKFLRTIGHPGGYVVGAWDPQRIDNATQMAIDKKGQLWHTEAGYWPKRMVCWDAATGEVRKQFLGNTQYGGGGVLDPKDKRRMYYGGLEFELDWQTGRTKLKNLTWRGASTAGELPAYVNGKQYMLTHAGFMNQPDNGAGTVYLYEEGKCRAVAAMGPAGRYPPFQDADFQEAYGKKFPAKPMTEMKFNWSDTNGDGVPEIDEVDFTPAPPQNFSCAYFETSDLSCGTNSGFRYEVKGFLPNGVPVYAEKAYPQLPAQPSVRFSDGSFEVMMTNGDFSASRNALFTADGKELASYKNEGFSNFAYPHATPWAPWKVVSELDVIGTGKSPKALGEFFVTDDNVGCWNVYTKDMMLAARIFREIRDPDRKAWSMTEHQRGLLVDDVTVGQEHFQGYFCQTSDGKYYVVAGHNHASVVEVVGLDDITRTQAPLDISADDLKGIEEYDHSLSKRLAYQNVKVMDVYPMVNPIHVDGNGDEWGSQPGGTTYNGIDFKLTYDQRYLYVLCTARNHGPLKNAGNDWHSIFRTGACVDLQIGTDPAADPNRSEPVKGDFRVLMTNMKDRAVAVLYQPVFPGGREEDRKDFHTQVARTLFDRVVLLETAKLGYRLQAEQYQLEAAIPLDEIGLTPTEGLRLKVDCGILQSGADGNEVLDRLWWSNKIPTPYDEAVEARMHPDLWGYARFYSKSKTELTGPKHGGTGLGDDAGTKHKKPEDIEDELEKGKVK